jgi:RHS repeat-associated protein
VVKTQYDYTREVPTGVKDPNLVITRSEYNDPYDRPTRVTAAYGLAVASRTEMTYPTATANETTVSKQLDSTRWLAYKTTYDSFGRPLTAGEAEDGNHASVAGFTIFSRHVYDGLGRVKFDTNPYRANSATTDGWTRTAYDLAGRVINLATFAGGPDSTPPEYPATTGTGVTWTGSVTTAYASEATTVTDQAGKQRKSVVDGLGRLVKVFEDPGSSNLETGYGYDARANLKTVTQGAQPQRTFSYDLLSRLTQATNPESGTINYTYDANSNLKTKQDARLITATYNYDALNRVTSRTYSDTTPPVYFYYDSQVLPSGAPSFARGLPVGRLVAVCYGSASASAGSYTGYDSLGRAIVSVQQTDGQNYLSGYGYNLAGMMTNETYPSGRAITNGYDGSGRLNSVNGQKTGEANKSYASMFSYTAQDAVASMQLGNGKYEHTTFNSRLQPTQIGLGIVSTDSSILRLDYGYGATSNNGNVLSQTITAPGLSLSQCYGYDRLNRLATAEERSGANCAGVQQWKQAFIYDRYGNRNFDVVNTTANVLGPNPTISQATNRFNTGQNYGYDGAGNLTSDPATSANSIVYDAENRQTQYTRTGQQPNSYFYDGDGHRVKKIDSSGTTVFVYNAAGQLIAEYTPGTPSGGGTSYLTSDHLGSTRVVMKSDGSVARHDYLPFGEEVSATIGGRGSVAGYSAPDTTRHRFTQKERDTESGLDYFLARYYSSAHGRFTSVDPAQQSAKSLDPQSWNRYSYTLNNPLVFVDHNGKWPTATHNRIIATALPGLRGTMALENIQHGSRSVDLGDSGLVPHTLLPSEAYKHAMVSANKITELGSYAAARGWAEKEMKKFIQKKVDEAKENVRKFEISRAINGVGDQNYVISAQKAFGEAIHPIMDNVSPAHRDFQVYDTSGWSLSAKGVFTASTDMYFHGETEKRNPTPEEMREMVDQIQKLFAEVFGA